MNSIARSTSNDPAQSFSAPGPRSSSGIFLPPSVDAFGGGMKQVRESCGPHPPSSHPVNVGVVCGLHLRPAVTEPDQMEKLVVKNRLVPVAGERVVHLHQGGP